MTARILDGKLYRNEIIEDLTNRVSVLKDKCITPVLGAVLIGDNPASAQYVGMKERDCAQVGVGSLRKDLPAEITQQEVLDLIDELNADDSVTGYIVQLPLPKHLDEKEILERIDPDKDVDGLTPINLGRMVLNIPAPRPCTAHGIVKMLERFDVPTQGAEVTIVGRGITVGRPLSVILSERPANATVTLCHTSTEDIAAHTRTADIVVAAAGVGHMLKPDMVKPGATVIDVGVSGSTGKTVGDVDPGVWEVAGAVSPNPGGVGPLTRAFLVSNVVEQAERQVGVRD